MLIWRNMQNAVVQEPELPGEVVQEWSSSPLGEPTMATRPARALSKSAEEVSMPSLQDVPSYLKCPQLGVSAAEENGDEAQLTERDDARGVRSRTDGSSDETPTVPPLPIARTLISKVQGASSDPSVHSQPIGSVPEFAETKSRAPTPSRRLDEHRSGRFDGHSEEPESGLTNQALPSSSTARALESQHEPGSKDVDPLLGLALARNLDESHPIALAPDPSSRAQIPGDPGERGPLPLAAPKSQAAVHVPTLRGAGDERTHPPTLTVGVVSLTDMVANETSADVLVTTRSCPSQQLRPHVDDPNDRPLHPSPRLLGTLSSVRPVGGVVDDRGEINTTQRDLEAGPDIPSPTDDTEQQV